MAREFVLGASGAYVNYDSLSALDSAFDVACRRHPAGVQITAETYRTVSGQGIGRTHAYRLIDGRIFRRSLANWQDAELEQTKPMIKLISVHSHPGNNDRDARLVTPAIRRDAVYSTSRGFVAVWMGQAVEGFLPSLDAAEGILASLTIGNGLATPEPVLRAMEDAPDDLPDAVAAAWD